MTCICYILFLHFLLHMNAPRQIIDKIWSKIMINLLDMLMNI